MFVRQLVVAVMLVAGGSSAVAQTTRIVRLTTTDDVGIMATYYPAERDRAPAVLLLHDLNKDRSEWTDFAWLLQRNGIAALTIDFRGHGESIRKLTAAGAVDLKLQDFTGRDLQDMLLDVEAAVDWLQVQSEIDKNRVVLIGASFGANVALRYAALNEDLAGVAVLSPGINYRGIRADDVVPQLGPMPVHIFVSNDDPYAFESSKRLIEVRKAAGLGSPDKELTICTGNLHGVPMLKSVKDLPQILLTWCQQALSGSLRSERGKTPAAPAPATPATAPLPPTK